MRTRSDIKIINSRVFKNMKFGIKQVSETQDLNQGTKKLLTSIELRPDKTLIEECKHSSYDVYNYDYYFKDYEGFKVKNRKFISIDSNSKYFVDNNEVDCMTFINTFESQVQPNDLTMEKQIHGYNIIIDTVDKCCKLVQLNCIGCIFVRQDKDITYETFYNRAQTCFNCVCCADCYNCESCKYCYECEMSKSCYNCVQIKFCINCNYCSYCKLCEDCNSCYFTTVSINCKNSTDIKYSNLVEDCLKVQHSYSCNSSHYIDYSSDITKSANIHHSKDINMSHWIQYSHEISMCDYVDHANYAIKSYRISYCSDIKFCESLRHSSMLYCCQDCSFSDESMILLGSRYCSKCIINSNIEYCYEVFCSQNTNYCCYINNQIHDYLEIRKDYIHGSLAHAINFDNKSHIPVDTRPLDYFIFWADKILQNMIPDTCDVGSYIHENDSIKLFIDHLINIVKIVNTNVDMFGVCTREQCEIKPHESMFNIQKIMDKIQADKIIFEQQLNNNNHDINKFKDDNNLFYNIVKLVINRYKEHDLKDTKTQDLCIEMIKSLFRLNFCFSNKISYCRCCDSLNNCQYCDNCFDSNDCLYCHDCLNANECKYVYDCDNCSNTKLCAYVSHCSYLKLQYYYESRLTLSHNNEETKMIVDCSCGCGKRIELDSSGIYRVYDEDNFPVYVGTTKQGYVYHEMSYQVYKKCYFEKCIDLEKYFENDTYFDSVARNNYLYVKAYDRMGKHVRV